LKKRIVPLVLLIILTTLFAPITFADKLPDPTKMFYVNDYAKILSDETERTIISTSASLAEKTGAQIVVVTVDSLDGLDIETYAYKLFKDWGIGDSKKNNGVLLLVAMDDRESRIEVGYGLEGALNDAKTGRIQDDYLIGNFKEKLYDEGVLGTYLKLAEEVYNEYDLDSEDIANSNVYYANTDSSNSEEFELTFGKVFLGIIIFIIVLLDLIFNRGRLTRFILYMVARSGRGGKGGGFGGFSGGGGRSGGGGSSRSW